MKRIFCTLLLACFLISAIPIYALGAASDAFAYTENEDGTVTIDTYTGTADELTVPDTLDGKLVTAIGSKAFAANETLAEVVLPKGITSIGKEAFDRCSKLRKISLPETLETIGYRAFFSCDSLETIDLPDGLIELGAQAFSTCSNLRTVRLPDTLVHIPAAAFSDCAIKTIDIPSCVEVIEDGAFNMAGLQRITGIQSVTEIGANVFANNPSLERIDLPTTLHKISANALPSSVTFKVGSVDTGLHYQGALDDWKQVEGCKDVEQKGYVVHFADGSTYPKQSTSSDWEYTEMDDGTLKITKYKGSASTLAVPSSFEGKKVSVIGESAFYFDQNIETLLLPDGIVSIEDKAFSQCVYLKEVRLPETIGTLGDWAFFECTGLKTIDLPDSLTDLGWWAFQGCSSLSEVQLPNNLTTIPQAAFAECSSLGSIYIPSSVETIMDSAFRLCNLFEVTGMESVKAIGHGVFEMNNGLQRVDLPKTLQTTGTLAMPGSQDERKVFKIGSAGTGMHFDGTIEQWSKVTGGDYYPENGYTVHCLDGALHPVGTVEDYAVLMLDTPPKDEWQPNGELTISNKEVWYAGSQAVLRIVQDELPDGFEDAQYVWYEGDTEIKPDDLEKHRRGNTIPLDVKEGTVTYSCMISEKSDTPDEESLLVIFEVTGTKPVLSPQQGHEQECKPGEKIEVMEAEWTAGPPIQFDGTAWPVLWEKNGEEVTGAEGLSYAPADEDVMGDSNVTFIAKCLGMENKPLAEAEFVIAKEEVEASPSSEPSSSNDPDPDETAPPESTETNTSDPGNTDAPESTETNTSTPSETVSVEPSKPTAGTSPVPPSGTSPGSDPIPTARPTTTPRPTGTVAPAPGSGSDHPYVPPSATVNSPSPTQVPTHTSTSAADPEPYLRPTRDASVKFETGAGTVISDTALMGLPIDRGAGTYDRTAFERDAEYPDAYTLEILDQEGRHLQADEPMATGHTVRLVNSRGEVKWTSTVIVAGDVLGTGRHSIAQINALAQNIAGRGGLSGPYLEAGDLNRNGRTEISDLAGSAKLLAS